MAKAGFCAVCQANMWLTEDGGCVHGHDASQISNVYEADIPCAPKPPATPEGGPADQFGRAMDDVAQGAEAAFQQVADTAKGAFEHAKPELEQAGEAAKVAAHEAGEAIGKAGTAAGAALKKLWDYGKKQAKNAEE